MARRMPALTSQFEARVDQAITLVSKIELARSKLGGSADRALLHPERLELVYELSFFRCYLAWEEFLEETFVRYLAGYVSVHHTPTLVSGVAYPTLAAAWAGYLGTKKYKLWHDPNFVVQRSQGFLVSAPHETVTNSALTDLQRYSAIRHRIAHAQEHARIQFDNATVALIGRKVKGSKAGRFLRQDFAGGIGGVPAPGYTWLHHIAQSYVNLARQIA
jgi:hypothetical protein